ncbi:MAG TPA: hypothetical protein PK156_08735 [Polyangium sp.]|nr:hypothetical protein [Polyangium sp.]
MARMEGVLPERAGWFARLGYFFARKKIGRVPDPMTIYAHNPWVLCAYGNFELGMEKASRVDKRIKALASIKAGSIVGCAW